LARTWLRWILTVALAHHHLLGHLPVVEALGDEPDDVDLTADEALGLDRRFGRG
jgi:hypothetical protein